MEVTCLQQGLELMPFKAQSKPFCDSMITGLGPKCASQDPPTPVVSNSQRKQLNCSISCQSEEERIKRFLGLSFTRENVVVVQLETLAESINVKILKEEIKKKQSQQPYLQSSEQS